MHRGRRTIPRASPFCLVGSTQVTRRRACVNMRYRNMPGGLDMDVIELSIYHPRVKRVESTAATIKNFRIRAEVEQEAEIVAAFQVPHPTGKDFWVVGLFD